MATVHLPVPLVVAGGALCLTAGYLLGVALGPDQADRTTATVVSYERSTRQLCLEGEAVAGDPSAEDGVLCGTLRNQGSRVPREGEEFRFVVVSNADQAGDERAVLIYGDVVD